MEDHGDVPKLSKMPYDVDLNLLYEANRLATFTRQWPYKDENSACCPRRMAEAGFYHCPSEGNDDLVRCFVCYKELVGWEPEDEPWEEHRSHSSNCFFSKLNKREDAMTIVEFVNVIRHMVLGIEARYTAKKTNELLEQSVQIKSLVEELTGKKISNGSLGGKKSDS